MRTLTAIVFNVSAGHSSVNYPQFDYLAYLPNRPDSLFQPMPAGEDDLTDEYVQSALPSELIAQFQISFAYVLTLPSVHNLASIDGVKDLYPDVHLRFMANLGEISQGINTRNAALVAAGKAPYPYLLPERIAASIAI